MDFTKSELVLRVRVKGKRGGARAITYVKVLQEIVTLATIYDKSEKEDISEKELNIILQSFLK